jgi:ribosomal protein L13E
MPIIKSVSASAFRNNKGIFLAELRQMGFSVKEARRVAAIAAEDTRRITAQEEAACVNGNPGVISAK